MKFRWTSLFVAAVLVFSGCSAEKNNAVIEKSSDMTAMDIAEDIDIGWNLGDTLDVCEADRDGDGKVNETAPDGKKVDETLWGNGRTTPELFSYLRSDGINAVRIPVTWRDHIGGAPDYAIDKEWMARVHEVVDFAMNEDMYVIINLHHDGGGDPEFGAWIRNASREYDAVEAEYIALWEQISESFGDYSEKLIFESMNEVGFDDMRKADAYTTLNRLNQTFVDTVRSSGGNNSTRPLLIAGYWTDTAQTCSSLFSMPKDNVPNRLMVSVHYYTPWEFCTTNIKKKWGTDSEIQTMRNDIDKLRTTFVDKGIPVVIGEYGVGTGNDADSRVLFAKTLSELSHDAGIPCFFWDNGEEYDRSAHEWRTEGLIEALRDAVK